MLVYISKTQTGELYGCYKHEEYTILNFFDVWCLPSLLITNVLFGA